MKSLVIFSILIISCGLINCQKEVEEVLEEGKSLKEKDESDSDFGTALIPSQNPRRGLIDRIREGLSTSIDSISERWDKIKDRMQERYQKHIERLQRKAVDSMESLKSYVDRKLASATDPSVKEYLQKLSQVIDSLMNSLRGLITSVESNISEAAKNLPKIPEIPEYKIGEN